MSEQTLVGLPSPECQIGARVWYRRSAAFTSDLWDTCPGVVLDARTMSDVVKVRVRYEYRGRTIVSWVNAAKLQRRETSDD